VGLKTSADPQQTRVGKNWGVQGGQSPHDGGHWGVSPTKSRLEVSSQPLQARHRVGFKTLADPQQTRVGKNWEWRGRGPLPGGLGDVPPKQKQGVSCQLLPTCHRVGFKTSANPQQTRVGKNWGVQGGEVPMTGGIGGCPPTKSRLGANSQPL